jgi:hypothetical protein
MLAPSGEDACRKVQRNNSPVDGKCANTVGQLSHKYWASHQEGISAFFEHSIRTPKDPETSLQLQLIKFVNIQ